MKKALSTLCGVLAALGLFAIMWLTLVDVSGRKLLDGSVPGSLELTELLLVLVIFSGLPLVSLHGEHVVFDSLDPLLPPWLRRVQQVIVDGFCLCALGGIAWLMWTKAGQMTEYGDTTAQLKWPLGPFVYGMSVLCGVTALVHGMLMIKPDLHAGSGAADAPGGA